MSVNWFGGCACCGGTVDPDWDRWGKRGTTTITVNFTAGEGLPTLAAFEAVQAECRTKSEEQSFGGELDGGWQLTKSYDWVSGALVLNTDWARIDVAASAAWTLMSGGESWQVDEPAGGGYIVVSVGRWRAYSKVGERICITKRPAMIGYPRTCENTFIGTRDSEIFHAPAPASWPPYGFTGFAEDAYEHSAIASTFSGSMPACCDFTGASILADDLGGTATLGDDGTIIIT